MKKIQPKKIEITKHKIDIVEPKEVVSEDTDIIAEEVPKVEVSEVKKDKGEFVIKFKKFRCFTFLCGLALSLILSLAAPAAVYIWASLSLSGNEVWYYSFGAAFGSLITQFIASLLLRRVAPSFMLGILFGLGFSLIIILLLAAALFGLIVWTSKSAGF